MPPFRVVVTEALDPDCAAWLGRHAEVTRADLADAAGLRAALAGADGLVVRTYTRVDAGLLEAAPRLRVVARAGVGLDNIDLEACRRRGIPVLYTPDANTQAVVEYWLLAVLGWYRPRSWLGSSVDSELWDTLRTEVVGERQLSELTLGILGVGRVGSRVAEVARALGMPVVAHDLLEDRVGPPMIRADMRGVLEAADILTLHADGRPSNHHMVGVEQLAALRPGALFVNTARGMLVDAAALAAWARGAAAAGGGAILDVHEPEPFGPDYPLLGLPNVRLAPHLASRTRTALRNMSWVVKDVVEVLEGRPPKFPS